MLEETRKLKPCHGHLGCCDAGPKYGFHPCGRSRSQAPSHRHEAGISQHVGSTIPRLKSNAPVVVKVKVPTQHTVHKKQFWMLVGTIMEPCCRRFFLKSLEPMAAVLPG